jgi:poly(3-hydroxybutyrate) depolymerase
MKMNRIIFGILILVLSAFTACLALFFRSSGCISGSNLTTGEYTIMSSDIERVYYLESPDNYDSNVSYSLVFALHGTGGDYRSWTEAGRYILPDSMKEESILVYPNALEKAEGEVTQWNFEKDLIFMDDLYDDLEANLCFDTRKVFATGHSDGGGFTSYLGCKWGNILRAIAPSSGGLLDHDNCIGQVAVIQIHGSSDTIVPPSLVKPGLDYWIAISSCVTGETQEGVDPLCIEYEECDPDFPVQYCEHSGGHEWANFEGDAIWNFFEGLPPAFPSNETGSGNIDGIGKAEISFKIHYPSDFVGTPEKLALALYLPDVEFPISVAPTFILNSDVPLGEVVIGEVTEYNNVEINISGVEYGDYMLTVTVSVEGGNYPIPTNGKDYQGEQIITIESSSSGVESPLEIKPIEMGF